MQLNLYQQMAVSHFHGPALVIAGPGSGKTAVITGRTLALIRSGISPENILVITFTRAAADGMRTRFYDLCRGEGLRLAGRPLFGTFHSVFFDILREETGLGAGSIADEADKRRLIKEIVMADPEATREGDGLTGLILDEISRVKGLGREISSYEPLSCKKDVFARIYVKYNRLLEKNGLIDFDDMIIKAYKLLKSSPRVLSSCRRRFRHILVDEFQDVNLLQYRLLLLISAPDNNLFAVGDDDQAIYGFRGSDPGFMKAFIKDLPGAVKIALDVNYRCAPCIINGAKKLISHNRNRFEKDIKPGQTVKGRFLYGEFENVFDENRAIIKNIKELLGSGLPAGEIAVLYRTAGAAGPLLAVLKSQGISFRCDGMSTGLFSHRVYNDLISYMRLASGWRGREDFLRIINKPVRYISREAFTKETVLFDDLLSFYSHSPEAKESIKRLALQLKTVRGLRPYAAANYIRKAMGYDMYLKQEAIRTGAELSSLTDIADEVMELAAGHDSFESFFDYVSQMETESKKPDRSAAEPSPLITVSTMHRAKGLEYTAVFLPDCNEGIVPYKKAKTPAETEEERRVFYVAVTRAKKILCVCHTRVRYGKDAELSRFVREMTEKRLP